MKQFIIDYITTFIETSGYYYFSIVGVLFMLPPNPETINKVVLGNVLALFIVSFFMALMRAAYRIKKRNNRDVK